MRTSVSFWDALFGERITLELPTADGGIRKVQVTAKWFEKMQREGMLKEIPNYEVKVNILDPLGGLKMDQFDDPSEFLHAMIQLEDTYRMEYWAIGERVSKELYDKFTDPQTGELYAIIVYEDGKPSTHLLIRSLWEQVRGEMNSA